MIHFIKQILFVCVALSAVAWATTDQDFKKEEIFSDERMDSTKVIQNQPDQSSPVSLKVTQSRKTEKPDENDFHRSWGIVWN